MNLYLQNKIILVTGGSSGIGAAISRLLAEEGAVPVIATREQELTEHFLEELHSQGKAAHAFYGELGEANFCKNIVEATLARFGKIDALVNNAGRNDGTGLERGSPERFAASLNDNLSHYYNLAHYALPYLKKTKGNIVNIASKVAITGQGNTSGYAASKGAILSLTREWAVELAKFGIRVNAILPAEVWTPLYENWIQSLPNPQEKMSQITAKIPLEHRMTTPEEIASAVAFLLSERSAHTTGQWWVIDGGYVHLDRALT